jgi:hypothetical protein
LTGGAQFEPAACRRWMPGDQVGHGYQPSLADGQITLRNCPFDALATTTAMLSAQ